jgi:hypothetical protein
MKGVAKMALFLYKVGMKLLTTKKGEVHHEVRSKSIRSEGYLQGYQGEPKHDI